MNNIPIEVRTDEGYFLSLSSVDPPDFPFINDFESGMGRPWASITCSYRLVKGAVALISRVFLPPEFSVSIAKIDPMSIPYFLEKIYCQRKVRSCITVLTPCLNCSNIPIPHI